MADTLEPALADPTATQGDPGQTIRAVSPTTGTTLRLPELSVSTSGAPAFRLEEVLGEGGMGVVRRATQAGLGRDVAVKHLRDVVLADYALALRDAFQQLQRLGSPGHSLFGTSDAQFAVAVTAPDRFA